MDRSRLRRWASLLLAPVLLAGCRGDDTVVYVPGPSFIESLHLTTSRRARARVQLGEPLVLHAQRRSGPWLATTAGEVEEGQCTSPTPPPELEIEVADRVTWLVSPQGHASLAPADEGRGAMEVRFDSVGTYHLSAESPSLCGEPFRGRTLVVEVVDEG